MSMKPFHGVANQWRSNVVTGIDNLATAVVLNSPTQPSPALPFKFSIDAERVRCSAYAPNTPTAGKTTYTIERAQDGTVAAAHLAGARAVHYASAEEIIELQKSLEGIIGLVYFMLGGAVTIIVGGPDSLALEETDVPSMALVVKKGAAVVSGQPVVIWEDTVTPTIVAPVTNSYRALIQLTQNGVITIKYGTQSGSPVNPSPDADCAELGSVLVQVADTSLVNADVSMTERIE